MDAMSLRDEALADAAKYMVNVVCNDQSAYGNMVGGQYLVAEFGCSIGQRGAHDENGNSHPMNAAQSIRAWRKALAARPGPGRPSCRWEEAGRFETFPRK